MVSTSWWIVNHLSVGISLQKGLDTAIMMTWLKSLQSHLRELFSKVSRFHLTWVNNHNSLSKIAWKDSPWWFAQILYRECLNPTWVGLWTGTILLPTIAICQPLQDSCPTTSSWMEIISYQTIRKTILIISMSEWSGLNEWTHYIYK